MKINKYKKGKVIIEKDSPVKKLFYIQQGKITDTKSIFSSGSFFGLVSFFTELNVLNDYRVLENAVLYEYDCMDEIPEDILTFFIKSLSDMYVGFSYMSLVGRMPDPSFIISNYNDQKSSAAGESKKDLLKELKGDGDLDDFIKALDFYINDNDEEVEIPQTFSEFKDAINKLLVEFNVSRFIAMMRGVIVKKSFPTENWYAFFSELFERSITLNDRALTLYIIYSASFMLTDLEQMNSLLRKHWEFLRFNGLNSWIDYVLRVHNNKLIVQVDD
jgi:hypothetical protein